MRVFIKNLILLTAGIHTFKLNLSDLAVFFFPFCLCLFFFHFNKYKLFLQVKLLYQQNITLLIPFYSDLKSTKVLMKAKMIQTFQFLPIIFFLLECFAFRKYCAPLQSDNIWYSVCAAVAGGSGHLGTWAGVCQRITNSADLLSSTPASQRQVRAMTRRCDWSIKRNHWRQRAF